MKQFYVKDLERLKDFGFKYRDGEYFMVTHRAANVWINEDSRRMVFASPSKDFIALICEMYKQDVIEIFDDKEEPTFNMKVTEEEMKMIFERRNANEQSNRK